MPIINPVQQFSGVIKNLVTSGRINSLSPSAQQQFIQAAESGGFPQTPEFQAAVHEASSQGLMPKMTTRDWIMLAAVPVAAFGGAALMGAGGGGAAAPVLSGTAAAPAASVAGGLTTGGAATGLAGAGTAGSVLPATSGIFGAGAGTGGLASIPTGVGVAGGSAAGAGGSGSFLDRLLHRGGSGGGISGEDSVGSDLSKLMGDYAQGEATNRGAKGLAYQNYDQLMLAAAGNRRTDESDAMKKMAQTSYLLGGGAGDYHQPTINGMQLPDYGFGPKAPSAAQLQGAGTLQQTLLDRLKPGGSYTPTDVNTYVNEGRGEKAAKYGGLAAGGLDVARRIFGF